MVLICNHPELVEQVIERDWPMSEKLQSMRGIKPKDAGKITYQPQSFIHSCHIIIYLFLLQV
jgi:hypothetical protein